ncbi:Protoporphyrinogen oxidase, partial [Teratosphaeria destructans]
MEDNYLAMILRTRTIDSDSRDNSAGARLLTIVVAFTSAAIFFVLTRIVIRAKRGALGSDDLWIAVALVFSMLLTASVAISVKHGYGLHSSQLAPDSLAQALFWWYLAQAFYKAITWPTKISILLMYKRVFAATSEVRWFGIRLRPLIWTMVGLCAACFTAFESAGVFACTPVQRSWDRRVPGTCTNAAARYYAYVAVNFATDVAVLAIPIPLINGLMSITRRQKLALTAVFMLGGFDCITTLIRIGKLNVGADITYTGTKSVEWSCVEANVGIICACLPLLRPVVSYLVPWLAGRTSYASPINDRGYYSCGKSDSNRSRRRSDGLGLDDQADAIIMSNVTAERDVESRAGSEVAFNPGIKMRVDLEQRIELAEFDVGKCAGSASSHETMLRRGHGLTRHHLQRRPSTLPPSLPISAPRRYESSAPDRAPSKDVAILGGGITGLASAYFLTRQLPRTKITIYEASDRIGGWLKSTRVPVKHGNVLFEAGPRTLRTSANGALAAKLLADLDLAKDAIFTQKTSPAARNRYVYYPDHLVRLPHPSHGYADNFWTFWREPIFESTTLAVLKEFFIKRPASGKPDESVGDFFSQRFSKKFVDRIVSAMLHGIYAGDAYQLSAKSLFPGPWRAVLQTGSLFDGMVRNKFDGVEVTKRDAAFFDELKKTNWDPLLVATLKDTSVFTFKDGIEMLVDRLARKLMENGNVEFKTGTSVDTMRPAEDSSGVLIKVKGSDQEEQYLNVISALSPKHLNLVNRPLVERTGPPPLVPTIPSVTVMTVNLYFRTPDLHPPGFGYVIPIATPFENNPERALGVVFDTAYSPGPQDLNRENWQVTDTEQLRQARDQGQLINVNDFAWYNMPDKPNTQDQVTQRGTKLTVMLGGHWWNDWPVFPDEQEGLVLARTVIRRHLGITEEPEAYQVNLQSDCIPQYTVGHERRLQDAHNNIWREYKGHLRVAGSWMSGVGVNDCLRSAYDVAESFVRGRDGTGLEHVGTQQEYVRMKPMPSGRREEEASLRSRGVGSPRGDSTMAEGVGFKTAILPVKARNIGQLRAVARPDDLLDELDIQLDGESEDAQNLTKAAEQLRSANLAIAFPTETVYGLGGDATRSESVRSIFHAKQRPADNPLIVHFASLKQLRALLSTGQAPNGHTTLRTADPDPIPTIYHTLIKRFWPGPLTLILPNPVNSRLAKEVTAGLSTFGARMPGHILSLALIQLADVPIAAPSANASTKPSPTAAEHVAFDLDGRIETILDGGPCDVGVESTVVDGLSNPPLILRPGGISIEQLRECPGWENVQIGYRNSAELGSRPRAPGMKYRHYSPKATVILHESGKAPPTNTELQRYSGPGGRIGLIRTKRWELRTDRGDHLSLTVQPRDMNKSRTNVRPGNGIAGLLATLNSTHEPRKALTTHNLAIADSQLSLFDIDLGADTTDIARGIFSALRELDRENVDTILVEGIDDAEGDRAAAVMNRLRKAAEVEHPVANGDSSTPDDDGDKVLTILVTGFGPFQEKFPVNPSYEIARSLPATLPRGQHDAATIHIIGYASPIRVCYDDARDLLPPLLAAYSPTVDMVLHLGMASGRQYYTAERYGHRDGYTRNKDVDGRVPPPDEPHARFPD